MYSTRHLSKRGLDLLQVSKTPHEYSKVKKEDGKGTIRTEGQGILYGDKRRGRILVQGLDGVREIIKSASHYLLRDDRRRDEGTLSEKDFEFDPGPRRNVSRFTS